MTEPLHSDPDYKPQSPWPVAIGFAALTALAIATGYVGVYAFAVAILFSIALHEFGHFITAKWFGIKVEQYFIGFGPKLWSTRRGETEYGIKALPLGGFVRIAGMNPYEEIPESERHRIFPAKKPWQRAIVLAAGSFTHFVVAFVILFILLLAIGTPNFERPTLTIAGVQDRIGTEPSPAAAAGLRSGDRIVSVDGRGITTWEGFTTYVRERPGEEIRITVERDDKIVLLQPTTVASARPDGTKQGYLGVVSRPSYENVGPVEAVTTTADRLVDGSWESLKAFKTIFSPTTISRLLRVAAGNEERSVEDPATVIGLAGAAGNLARAGNFETFFLLIASVNIFIGVANLLPLPPLDGGHLAVLGWEKIRRRPVDMRRLLPLTAAVIAVFSSLFLLLLYLDIVSPLPSLG